MASYRFCLLRQGRLIETAIQEFDDDLDALDRARELSADFDVEVWQGSRRALRVKMYNAPLNIHDATSN